MSSHIQLEKDVFPIFVVRKSDTVMPVLFCGTGFLIAPHVLITCWHCISQTLASGQLYAALVKETEGYTTHFLLNMQQHSQDLDLAIAQVDIAPEFGLSLSMQELLPGDDVITYGYPPVDKVLAGNEDTKLWLNARFLRGYITRSFYYDHADFARTHSYELDMPLTENLCGAPIIKRGTKEVAGVIFGNLSMPGEKYSPKVEHKTKKRQPRNEQSISFGLAHHTDSLWSLQGMASNGQPLGEFLRISSKPDKIYDERITGLPRQATTTSVTAIGKLSRIASLYRQVKQAPSAFISRHNKPRAVIEMEKLRQKLEKYEAQLTPKQLELWRRQRRIVEELKAMHQDEYSDYDTLTYNPTDNIGTGTL